MRILYQVVQPFLQVHGWQFRKFHHPFVGARYAKPGKICFPHGPCIQHGIAHGGVHRIGAAHVQLYLVHRLLFAAHGFYPHLANANAGGGFQCKHSQGITRFFEAQGLCLGALTGKNAIRGHFYFHRFHPIFHGEYIYRKVYFFARTEHPRQGTQHHHRTAHRHGYFSVSISQVLSGYHHHPHRADVVGDVDLMRRGFAFRQMEWPQVAHHRLEANRFLLRRVQGFIVATDAEQAPYFFAKSADHHIVHIPGAHAQGFGRVKKVPGIGGFIPGKVEQSFVHHGQGIGHGAARCLGNAYAYRRFRTDHRRGFDHWLQACTRIFDANRHQAKHADGPVVGGLRMGLNQCDMGKYIRRHFGGDRDFHFRFALCGFHPEFFDDARPIFDAYQCPPIFRRGESKPDRLAHIVGFLVAAEGQHGARFAVAAVGAHPVRPVEIHHFGRGVPALQVFHHDQVAAPVVFVHADGEAALALTQGGRLGADLLVAAAV